MNTQPTIATTVETQSLEIGQVIQGENCKLVVTTIKVKSNEVESKEIELKFAIAKTPKGKFYGTINGKRFSRWNFVRKYEAVSELRRIEKHYDREKLIKWLNS